jgi:hypothetical protein
MSNIESESETNKIELVKNNEEEISNTGKSLSEKTPFWSENPNVLIQTSQFDFFPVDSMTYAEKLNAISRTVIILTMVSFIFTQNVRLLVISAITLFAIYLLYVHQMKKQDVKTKENFTTYPNPALDVISQYPEKTDIFQVPSSTNPFANVLMTDYDYNPDKKPAPPAFNTQVNNTILEQAKNLVRESNPGNPDISNKLFKDLGEEFEFEQSLQPFYSNPNTMIPNDQTAFAEFCYGSMVSCKEGNLFACARNMSHYTNY